MHTPEEHFMRPELTLDLAGLSDVEKQEGSILLGGSGTTYVGIDDAFEYRDVTTIVFRWGDARVHDVFSQALEHTPELTYDLLPFSPSTIIEDMVWSLALQDKNFNPLQAYQDAAQYIVLPFEADNETTVSQNISAAHAEGKQVLGQIASRYVLFENAISLLPQTFHEEQDTPVEKVEINGRQALELTKNLIHHWNFDASSLQETNRFVLQTSHWLLELCGQQGLKDKAWTAHTGDTIPGASLPLSLQKLVMYVWKNELGFTNDNRLRMESHTGYYETDPVIPRYDEISALPTFKEQLAFARAHPEIINNIQPGKVEVWPEVRLLFDPDYMHEWGLEFIINPMGVAIYPYGRAGHTKAAARYANETMHTPKEVAKTTLELMLLAADKITEKREIQSSSLTYQDLIDRLDGNAEIPVSLNSRDYRPKPENAMKDLLIEYLLSGKSYN